MALSIAIHTDGDNEPFGLQLVVAQWKSTWNKYYGHLEEIEFHQGLNLKQTTSHHEIAPHLKKIVEVRNPDLYFVEVSRGIELGGIEITTHSPDGSNVEKRYPYIWISRREGINAFVISPYLKLRPQGQANKLPYRHAHLNELFLRDWTPNQTPDKSIHQIVPVLELQLHQHSRISPELAGSLISLTELGDFFAHTLATKVFFGEIVLSARQHLNTFRQKLLNLVRLCKENADHTDPSTLLKLGDRWIQVYNARPESGHWERGEGQFDSIDGRLMFTLDWFSFLPMSEQPNRFEFWLPQMTSKHPWITEQVDRGYGSKRLRNILVVLREYCTTKFADELDVADWRILQANSRLLLERLDWKPGIYRVSDLVSPDERLQVATEGIGETTTGYPIQIARLLSDETLFFSAHRAYGTEWESSLSQQLRTIPEGASVLVPRIPLKLLSTISQRVACTVIGAEECTKEHLLMLRQLHRAFKNNITEYRG